MIPIFLRRKQENLTSVINVTKVTAIEKLFGTICKVLIPLRRGTSAINVILVLKPVKASMDMFRGCMPKN